MSNPTRYHSYLIRMWAEEPDTHIWRFSAENIHTQARSGFSSLEELFAFLEHSLSELPQTNETTKGDTQSNYDS
ncbi:MAG: hypothetical protein H6658_06510 [Ardenticatenaceae bacterium]|nr:hypothetical protein [Ardenticatenaceae bacterium]